MRLIIFLLSSYIASRHAVVLDGQRLNLADPEYPVGSPTFGEVRARQNWQPNHVFAGDLQAYLHGQLFRGRVSPRGTEELAFDFVFPGVV